MSWFGMRMQLQRLDSGTTVGKRSGRERDALAARGAGSGVGRVEASGAVKGGGGGGGKGGDGGETMQGHAGSHVHFDVPGGGERKQVVTSVAEAREEGHGSLQAPRKPPTGGSAGPGGGGVVAPGNAAAVFGHPATFAPGTTTKEVGQFCLSSDVAGS